MQRLADVVAGKFCYGVMAASGATFAFWSLAGADWFPQALGELTDEVARSAVAVEVARVLSLCRRCCMLETDLSAACPSLHSRPP